MDSGYKDGDGGGGGYALRREGAPRSDAQVLAGSGLLIQSPDGGGGWRTVRHSYPRAEFSESFVDSLAQGTLRLVFLARHKLRFVGRLAVVADSVQGQKLAVLAALHSRLGDVSGALTALGNVTTELAPGDTVSLEFAAPPVAAGQARELFLLSRGVYTSSLPASRRAEVPTRFALRQNQPNPFRATTMIRFDLPASEVVRLELFDAQGRRLRVLANQFFAAGYQAVAWDGRNEAGELAGPGIYFYRIEAGAFRARRKMTLLP